MILEKCADVKGEPMRSLRKYFPVFLTALMIFLAGCVAEQPGAKAPEANGGAINSADQSKEKVIKHSMGETKITGTPERIIVLDLAYVDSLVILGLSPIGIADSGDSSLLIDPILKQVEGYTSVGAPNQPDLEKIRSLKPDLIVADMIHHEGIYSELINISPTIVLSGSNAGHQDILDGFSIVAQAVGKGDQVQKVMDGHFEKIGEIASKIPPDESRYAMSLVVSDQEVYADFTIGALLDTIGLRNVFAKESTNTPVSLDEIVEMNPDILFVIKGSGGQNVVDGWKNDSRWQSIHAVQNGAVYEVEFNLWLGSRGLISSEAILEDAVQQVYGK